MVVSEKFLHFMRYETEEDLYAASELVVQEGLDIGWYVTPRLNVSPAQWVAWDDANPADPGYSVHPTYEDAVSSHVAAVEDAPGAVRPRGGPVMKRAPKETLPVRFPPAMIAEIRAVAAARDLLPSELVREAVRLYLAASREMEAVRLYLAASRETR